MFTKSYKVHGFMGHRQKASFAPSFTDDFSRDGITRIIECINGDKLGTNEYCIVRITRDSEEECVNEMFGQLNDGIFENFRFGEVFVVDNDTFEVIDRAAF